MKGFQNIRAYVHGTGIVKTNIGIEDGKIAYIGEDSTKITEPIQVVGNPLLTAGFIDQHIHGAGGADAMDGTEEALQTISKTIAREGTMGFLATTMTQSPENIRQALKTIKEVMEKGEYQGAEVLGVHLEGPFISPKHIGAQPLEYVATPATATFNGYDISLWTVFIIRYVKRFALLFRSKQKTLYSLQIKGCSVYNFI